MALRTRKPFVYAVVAVSSVVAVENTARYSTKLAKPVKYCPVAACLVLVPMPRTTGNHSNTQPLQRPASGLQGKWAGVAAMAAYPPTGAVRLIAVPAYLALVCRRATG